MPLLGSELGYTNGVRSFLGLVLSWALLATSQQIPALHVHVAGHAVGHVNLDHDQTAASHIHAAVATRETTIPTKAAHRLILTRTPVP